MSDLSDSLTVAHLSWATWAICSWVLICLEQSKQIAHSRSFDLSEMSKWAMSKWANSQPWITLSIPSAGHGKYTSQITLRIPSADHPMYIVYQSHQITLSIPSAGHGKYTSADPPKNTFRWSPYMYIIPSAHHPTIVSHQIRMTQIWA